MFMAAPPLLFVAFIGMLMVADDADRCGDSGDLGGVSGPAVDGQALPVDGASDE